MLVSVSIIALLPAVWIGAARAADVARPAAAPIAAVPAVAAKAALTPLVVPLVVNHKELGDIDVDVDSQGSGLADSRRLLSLLDGILAPEDLARLRERVGGRVQTPIGDLSSPGIAAAFDAATLELHVDIEPAHLGETSIVLAGRAPPDLKSMQPPAHLGSAVAMSVDQPFQKFAGRTVAMPLLVNLDGFVTLGGFPGTTARFGGTWTNLDHGAKWQRSQTRLTRDFFDNAVRLDAGEFNLPVTGFQGAGPLLGLSLARDYDDIRPFQNIHPSGRSALTLDRDSTIIVYVNGVENRRLHLSPGRYAFSDFGVPYGSSTVTLVVEDLAGRREVTNLSLFNAFNLLQKDVTDFGLSAGLRPGISEGTYGGTPLVSGYWAKGFTDRFTAGAGAQVAARNWLMSGEAAAGLPLGIIDLTTAASRYDGRAGSAVALDYRNEADISRSSTIITTFSAEAKSARFASPYQPYLTEVDERWRVDARVEWRRRLLTLALGAHAAAFRHSAAQRTLELSATTSVRQVSTALTIGLERTPRGRVGAYIGLGVSLRLGGRQSADARYDTHADHLRSIELSRSNDDQVGDVSGRIATERDSRQTVVAGEVNYVGNRFLAHAEDNVAYENLGDDTRESHLRLSTALIFADGSLGLGRPSDHGFIVLPVYHNLNGAKVTVRDEADRVQARSGLFGPAVVPLESSYTERTYNYDVDGLPDGYNLTDTAPRFFPGQASPYRVQIGTSYWKMALGYLFDNGKPVAERTATIASETDSHFQTQTIFTNSAGRFVADGLAAGTYVVRYDNRTVAHIIIPDDRNGLINVGKIDISGHDR